jgi:hypothetical protein
MGNSALPALTGSGRHVERRQAKSRCVAISVGTLALILSFACPFAAQSTEQRGSDAFEIISSVIAGGGVNSATGGCFSLDATLGQPVVGRAGGGAFVLAAGFWMQSPLDEIIFRNGFENGMCPP